MKNLKNEILSFWSIIAFCSLRNYLSRSLIIVESSIKQIGRSIKISGAQWNQKNVAQILKHRCAYLNGLLDSEYLYSSQN